MIEELGDYLSADEIQFSYWRADELLTASPHLEILNACATPLAARLPRSVHAEQQIAHEQTQKTKKLIRGKLFAQGRSAPLGRTLHRKCAQRSGRKSLARRQTFRLRRSRFTELAAQNKHKDCLR
jgi:hypothetical protein